MAKKTEQMKKIKEEVVLLKNSPLYEFRLQNGNFPVIGEGSHDAKIMFVGEAPGRNEAKTGRPFCGAAGKILDELLALINISRADVYITNIVKDRPPQNRDPLPEEIEIYAPFLDRQIDTIQPAVIATLGRFSMAYIMEKYGLKGEMGTIGQIHGKIFNIATNYGKIKIIPLYHPATAIYDNKKKGVLKKDFEILRQFKN